MIELTDYLRAIWSNGRQPQPYESARQHAGHLVQFTPKILRLIWPARWLLLLTGDGLFLLLHLLLVLTPLTADAKFYLNTDGGYAEWFQYIKLGAAVWMLMTLYWRQRSPLHLYWLGLFAYLLGDDALRLHEIGGLWLANLADLPAVLSLRPQDLGELAISSLIGLFLLTTLTLAYRLSDDDSRAFTRWLLLTLLALAIFGIGADMLQEMAGRPFLRQLLVVVEDGGEMVMISLMLWLVYRKAESVNGWTAAQVGAKAKTTVAALSLLILFTAVLAAIQYGTPGLVGNDGYYHARMGLLVRQQGLTPTPPQLPHTILNEAEFYDHHLLYHLYLALFTTAEPALDGGLALTKQVKMATIILSVLPFLAIWWLLRGQRVPGATLWALALLALSEAFLYRLSMPRVQSASLLVLIVGLHWLLHGRYRLLLPLGFLYVWLYDAFPLLLVVGGIYFIAIALTERRLLWAALVYPAVGIVIGLVVNPYFPQNLTFIGRHLLPKLWQVSATPVGSEWYPYTTWELVQNSGLALLLLGITILLFNWHGRRLDGRLLTLFLLTALFGLMLFRARRFIEYFPPFVLILAALSLSPLLTSWLANRPLHRHWLLAGVTLLLVMSTLYTARAARTAVRHSLPADQYAAAALWLNAYSQPGSTIFQIDWDDFTRLFFYDPDNTYLIGLDPTFLSMPEPALYAEWVQITQGKVLQSGTAIRQRFRADYVFSDVAHEAFLQQAAVDPGLLEIYRDQYAVIYAVTP
jgi:hypothetical protein